MRKKKKHEKKEQTMTAIEQNARVVSSPYVLAWQKEKWGKEGKKEEATYVNQESGAILKDRERDIDSPRATSKRYVRG